MTVQQQVRVRRLVVVGFLAGLWWVGLFGVASADNCSSPSDCSRTAWTVGGGAAVAGAIIAAATAAGVLGPPQTDPERVARIPEDERAGEIEQCRERLTPLKQAVDDAYRGCADAAGEFEGAQRMRERADGRAEGLEDVLEELRQARAAGVTDWRGVMRAARDRAHAAPGRGLASVADLGGAPTGALGGAGLTATGVQRVFHPTDTAAAAARATRLQQIADARARAAMTFPRGSPAARLARIQRAQQHAAGRLSAFGHALGVLGTATTVATIHNTHDRVEMSNVIGITRQRRVEARTEVAQWTSWARRKESALAAAEARYATAAQAYNNAIGTCPFARVETTFTRPSTLFENTAGFRARPPVHGVAPPREPDEDPAPRSCHEYEADRAAYERDLADYTQHRTPRQQELREKLRRWYVREADIRYSHHASGILLEQARTKVRLSTGAKVASVSFATTAGLLAALLPPAGVVFAVGAGFATFVVSIVASEQSIDEARAELVGRLARHREFLAKELGYAEAEVRTLERLLGHDLDNLRRRYVRLRQRHHSCIFDTGSTAEPPTEPVSVHLDGLPPATAPTTIDPSMVFTYFRSLP